MSIEPKIEKSDDIAVEESSADRPHRRGANRAESDKRIFAEQERMRHVPRAAVGSTRRPG